MRRSGVPVRRALLAIGLAVGVLIHVPGPADAGTEPFVLVVRVEFEGRPPADETYTVEVRCSPRGGATFTFTRAGERTLETNADECSVDAAFPEGSTGLTYRCRSFAPARCTDEVNIVRRDAGASGGQATVTVIYEYPPQGPTTSTTAAASTTTVGPSTTAESSSTTRSPSTTTTSPGSTTTTSILAVDTEDDGNDDSSTAALVIAGLLAAAVLGGAGVALTRELRGARTPDDGGTPPA